MLTPKTRSRKHMETTLHSASFPPLPWHVPPPDPRAHSGPTCSAMPLHTGWELPWTSRAHAGEGGRQLRASQLRLQVASEWGKDGMWHLSGQCTRSSPVLCHSPHPDPHWVTAPASPSWFRGKGTGAGRRQTQSEGTDPAQTWPSELHSAAWELNLPPVE